MRYRANPLRRWRIRRTYRRLAVIMQRERATALLVMAWIERINQEIPE